MRGLVVVLALVLLALAPVMLRAQERGTSAEEKLRELQELMRKYEEVKAARNPEWDFEDGDKRVLRLYNVADLTVRLTSFVHPNLALRPAGSEIDEDRPIFGRAREGEHSFSGPEELMDMITGSVRPDVWDTGWASINVSGLYGLMVLAEEDVHGEIASFLGGLRRMVGKTVTVEVRLIELDASTEMPAGGQSFLESREDGLVLLRRAEAGEGMRLLRSARITGMNGQRVSVHAGAQRSFVQDYDVEVAQDSSISDPIVGISQTGLAFDVRPIARGEGLISLEIMAQSNLEDGAGRNVVTPSGPVLAPKTRFAEFNSTVTIPDGGFAVIAGGGTDGGGRWIFLVSAAGESIVGGGGK